MLIQDYACTDGKPRRQAKTQATVQIADDERRTRRPPSMPPRHNDARCLANNTWAKATASGSLLTQYGPQYRDPCPQSRRSLQFASSTDIDGQRGKPPARPQSNASNEDRRHASRPRPAPNGVQEPALLGSSPPVGANPPARLPQVSQSPRGDGGFHVPRQGGLDWL